MAEHANGASRRIDPHDAHIAALAKEYFDSCAAEFFGDAKAVAPDEWAKAAAGLVTLILLALIIISQAA